MKVAARSPGSAKASERAGGAGHPGRRTRDASVQSGIYCTSEIGRRGGVQCFEGSRRSQQQRPEPDLAAPASGLPEEDDPSLIPCAKAASLPGLRRSRSCRRGRRAIAHPFHQPPRTVAPEWHRRSWRRAAAHAAEQAAIHAGSCSRCHQLINCSAYATSASFEQQHA